MDDRGLVVAVAGGEQDGLLDDQPVLGSFYAESQDGGWWGDTAGPQTYVTDDVFDNCYAIGHSGWRLVGMAEINVGWPPSAPFTHTINLNP